jgi:poly-beta-1,6-N-acetyl-D-glucosamine synthase
MVFIKYIFFVSVFIVVYNYAGYAVLAYILNKINRRKNSDNDSFTPSVSFIVAAYNEEDCIEEKIKNCLLLQYPAHLVEYIFIADGSADKTVDIIRSYPQVTLLYEKERKGKTAALNRAVALANHEILIFNDANTILNKEAIAKIAKHYASAETGGVAGEKKVLNVHAGENLAAANEGIYWKYESVLKKIDSEFYSVVGAAGELFSIRRELYEQVPENVILDDFVISLRVAARGYRIIYEPQAYASELPSATLKDEKKRKVRIAAGGFQAIVLLKKLLLFWKHPRLSFLYISHRVLRWAVTPFCLVLALVCNAVLFFGLENPFYKISFLAQLCFYGLAFVTLLLPSFAKNIKLAKLASYFVFMNVSVLQGFFKFLKGNQSAAWDKANRSAG